MPFRYRTLIPADIPASRRPMVAALTERVVQTMVPAIDVRVVVLDEEVQLETTQPLAPLAPLLERFLWEHEV